MGRIIEMPEVTPRHTSGGSFTARLSPERGLIRGIAFDLEGTSVTDSAINDDTPWTLISRLEIIIPLKRGDVKWSLSGRDAFLVGRYLTGKTRENVTPITALPFFSSFLLPFGGPGWGIHTEALRADAEIVIKGTWAAPAAYGAAVTAITAGILRPSLVIDPTAVPNPGRLCILGAESLVTIATAARFPKVRLNKPDLAEGLVGIMYRQQDASVAAINRVDGLVTRVRLNHPTLGVLHDVFWRTLRQSGIEWAGIDPTQVTAALPLGLDGTAFYAAAPEMRNFPSMRGDLSLDVDCAETVQLGVTNVANAAGDSLSAIVLATISPGA